jgi:hypothetical protein
MMTIYFILGENRTNIAKQESGLRFSYLRQGVWVEDIALGEKLMEDDDAEVIPLDEAKREFIRLYPGKTWVD